MAVRVISGKAHECTVLYELVKQFVEAVGPGVVKRLILDRGFLDGKAISLCKRKYGIDILIPIRKNMDLYEDALALFREPEVNWVECKEEGRGGEGARPSQAQSHPQTGEKATKETATVKGATAAATA